MRWQRLVTLHESIQHSSRSSPSSDSPVTLTPALPSAGLPSWKPFGASRMLSATPGMACSRYSTEGRSSVGSHRHSVASETPSMRARDMRRLAYLRSYSNQIHHESLVRGHAKRILEDLV